MILDVDNVKILFPLHVVAVLPNAPDSLRESHIRVDPETIEINPAIPLAEFQLDPSQAEWIFNTDTQELTLAHGNALTPDLTPAPIESSPLNHRSKPASSSKWFWFVLANVVIVLSIVSYWGITKWRR